MKKKMLLLSILAVTMGFLLLAASSYAQTEYSPNSISTNTPLQYDTVTPMSTPMYTATPLSTICPQAPCPDCLQQNPNATPLPNMYSNPAMCPTPLRVPTGDGMNDISVRIGDLRSSDKGQIIVALYDANAAGFPWHPENALRTAVAAICDDVGTVRFENVPDGEYVVMAFHDADCDNRIDMDIDGVPLEGYAMSGNQRRGLDRPRFDDASFMLNNDRALYLRMQYESSF